MKALAQNTLIQNRYLVVHLIGKGGMGEVYLAVDQRLGSAVALKRTYFAGDEMLGNAFEREARTLARMRHPVLPKVSDHFGENDEQYLVMEHIAGDDLAKRLEAAQKPFPVSWVMFWADQLLDALSYLHSHEPPIIHRDIKPQNLKLTDDNHIILLDFGLSKSSTPGQTNMPNSGSTGSVVGYTPHYAPMEQIRGIGTNARSDLYSLSATLYQLMTNVVPADALTRADAMLNGLSDPIEPPHEINPEIPASVAEVILKGMEVSQERRFGAAREMQKALRRAFTQMQEAMAAQTVAFNLGEVIPAEQPMSSAIEKTQLMPTEPLQESVAEPPEAVSAENGSIDFDATLAFDPAENLEHAQQTGIRTDLYAPSESNGEVGAPSQPILSPQDDLQNSFVTVAAGASAFSAAAEPIEDESSPEQATVVASRPSRKVSGGRVFAIIGGLAAFLVLAAGAGGAAWYFYNNYYGAAAVIEPTPSPEPTVEESPLPAATVETAVESNSSTDENGSVVTESNDDSNANVSQNDSPSLPTRTDTEGPTVRPNPPGTKAANRPAATPATRPTPKPKRNPGRTDIEQ